VGPVFRESKKGMSYVCLSLDPFPQLLRFRVAHLSYLG